MRAIKFLIITTCFKLVYSTRLDNLVPFWIVVQVRLGQGWRELKELRESRVNKSRTASLVLAKRSNSAENGCLCRLCKWWDADSWHNFRLKIQGSLLATCNFLFEEKVVSYRFISPSSSYSFPLSWSWEVHQGYLFMFLSQSI